MYHCYCKIIKFIFEIFRINETFVYTRVLFMDTHISHYSGISDLRYACQLVSLYTREINKTTYFSEFQYQRNSCFHSMEFLESSCIDENKKKIYNRLILLHWFYCPGKVTRIFFQVLYRNNFNIVLLEKRAYFIFKFFCGELWYIIHYFFYFAIKLGFLYKSFKNWKNGVEEKLVISRIINISLSKNN